MSLPVRQQRSLSRIEKALMADDARLRSHFAVFAKLTVNDAMPGTEQIMARRRRLLQPALFIPVAVRAVLRKLAATRPTRARRGGSRDRLRAEPDERHGLR